MIRKIITIDENKCNGCGLCADACHEAAIGMRDGKAVLLKDDYCDGLGDCLPVCPTGAISFVEREAAGYDEAAVRERLAKMGKTLKTKAPLLQWPVQIRLVPVTSANYENADLLVSADCAAYACKNFHEEFIHNRVTLIGCPKLDDTDYSAKLAAILESNDIKSVTVARMEVPCCGGLENAVKKALQDSGKQIPMNVVTITTDGGTR